MKKLKLDLDDLVVETFATAVPRQRGTAVAFESLYGPEGCDTLHPNVTCANICQGDTQLALCTAQVDCGGSGACTMNLGAADCVSYAVSCPPTVYVYETCVC